MKKIIIISILISISLLYAALPKNLGTTIALPGDETIDPLKLNWDAYDTNNPSDILTKNSYDCKFVISENLVKINIGNFDNNWAAGDTIVFDYLYNDFPAGYQEIVLNASGYSQYYDSVYELTIVEPSITVTSPIGGETWERGGVYSIKWTSEYFTGDVKIELLLNGSRNRSQTLVSSTDNDGEWEWIIPGLQSLNSGYSIRISDASDGEPSGESPEYFEIIQAEESNIVINEIMYNPSSELGDDADYEFIELYNNSSEDVVLSGWSIDGIDYEFGPDALLEAWSYVVVARDPVEIGSHYGISNLVGPYTGWLGNSGETLTLKKANGLTADQVSYSNSNPWPSEADGDGCSAELIAPELDNNVGSNWQASYFINGTPGVQNTEINYVGTIFELRQRVTELQYYCLTGEAIVTFVQDFNNQIYIQDETAGILIDDTDHIITSNYNVGYGMTKLTGTLSSLNGMLTFIPGKNPGSASSTGNSITPELITLAQFNSNFSNYEAELVTIQNIVFTDGSIFDYNMNYNLSDERATGTFKTFFDNVDYLGTLVPQTPVNITALCNVSGEEVFLTSRDLNDIEELNVDPEINLPEEGFSLNEDSYLDVDFSPYLNDLNNDELVLTASGHDNIIVNIDGFNVRFSAVQDWNGQESIVFTIDDQQSRLRFKKSNRAIAQDTVVVTVNPINDEPTIDLSTLEISFEEDGTLPVDFSTYIEDVEDDEVYLSSSTPSNIIVEITDHLVDFSAPQDWYGSEDVVFYVYDEISRSNSADTITVIVYPVNDDPIISLADLDVTFDEDSELLIDFGSYISDIDNEVLVLTSSGSEHVLVEVNGYNVTFSSEQDWNGSETVFFTIDDQMRRSVCVDSVLVTVNPIQDAPLVSLPETITFQWNVIYDVNFAENIFEADGDDLDITYSGNDMIDVLVDGFDVSFSVSEHWTGNEYIAFQVSDGTFNVLDTINVVVTEDNSQPIFENLPEAFSFKEDESLIVDFSLYAVDYDEDPLVFGISGNDSIIISQDGMFVQFSAPLNWNGMETLTISLDDQIGRAVVNADIDIVVRPQNDAPVLSNPIPDINIDEDETYGIDLNNVFSDIDGDDLVYDIMGNNNISFEITEGYVLLNPDENWFGTEILRFIALDDSSLFVYDTTVVTVISVNDNPEIDLSDLNISFDEDGAISYDFGQFISDADDDVLILTNSETEFINVVITNYNVDFSAQDNWFGEEMVVFTVNDQQGRAIDSDSINVVVNAVNDDPTIDFGDLIVQFNEDSVYNLDLSAYINDIDNDILTLTYSNNANINVSLDGFSAQFSADENWFGSENIVFSVTDMASRELVSDTILVEVISVNDAPLIDLSGLNIEFEEDEIYNTDFSSYINDIDSDSLVLSIIDSQNIDVIINGFNVTFDSNDDWNGSEDIVFVVNDLSGRAIDSDTLLVTVIPVNDSPTIDLSSLDVSFDEDSFIQLDFTSYINDVDGDQTILSALETEYVNIEINGNTVVFSSQENWHGEETVVFSLSDDIVARATVYDTILVSVNSINDAPIIDLSSLAIVFDEDTSLVEDFSPYISDIDSDILTLGYSNNVNVLIEIDSLTVTFSSTDNWFGEELIVFTINDNESRTITTDTITVIVESVNDAPQIDLTSLNIQMDEDSSLLVDFTPYISDLDDSELTLSASETEFIEVAITDFDVNFEPEANWFGVEQVIFTVNDNNGRSIASDTIAITVNSVNDSPEINVTDNIIFNEDDSLLVDFSQYISDIDDEMLTLTSSESDFIDITIDGLNVNFISDADWFGSEEIVFTINDNNTREIDIDTVLVIVENVNDSPEIFIEEGFSFDENDSLIVDFSAYVDDIDSENLTLSVDDNINVNVEINDLMVTFSATYNWYGIENITFSISDDDLVANEIVQVEVIQTVFAPANLDYSLVGESVNLTWDYNNDRSFSHFNIYRNDVIIDTTSALTYLDSDVSFNNTYTYYVTSVYVDPDAESDQSNSIEVQVVGTEPSNTPKVTNLSGNYPNPFSLKSNSRGFATSISFDVAEDCVVNMEIYNILGQKVCSLLNEYKEAGTHSIKWNGKNDKNDEVSSGIYFYRMTTSKYSSVKKMMIIQ